MLFLIDGKRGAAQVRSMAALAGVPDHCCDELLALGLIAPPSVGARAVVPAAVPASLQEVDLPLPVAEPLADARDGLPEADSVLPASRTLSPESIAADSRFNSSLGGEPWGPPAAGEGEDILVTEAREILLRAVRTAAPVAGSITVLRLRRARTRTELRGLLDEVAQRIGKPPHSLVAAQTIRRVRGLLEGRSDAALPA